MKARPPSSVRGEVFRKVMWGASPSSAWSHSITRPEKPSGRFDGWARRSDTRRRSTTVASFNAASRATSASLARA